MSLFWPEDNWEADHEGASGPIIGTRGGQDTNAKYVVLMRCSAHERFKLTTPMLVIQTLTAVPILGGLHIHFIYISQVLQKIFAIQTTVDCLTLPKIGSTTTDR